MSGLAHVSVPALLNARWRARLDEDLKRIDAIIESPINEDAMRELVILHNNCEYLLLFAEASDQIEQLALDQLRGCVRAADRAERLATALQLAHFASTDVEKTRKRLLGIWTDGERHREMASSLHPVIRASERRDRSFLDKIGINVDASTSAEEAYLRATSTDLSADTRRRLTEVWEQHREVMSVDAVTAVNKVVSRRRRAAAAANFASPGDATFRRANISMDAARAFLDEFIVAALADRRLLDDEVASVVGAGNAAEDLPRLLRVELARQQPTTFKTEQTLDAMMLIAERCLDIEIAWKPGNRYRSAYVFDRYGCRGEIHIDGTIGVSEGTRFRSEHVRRALPIASILCVEAFDGVVRTMTARAVQAMLHELGHALHHLLARRRTPSDGGLDYAPLERLDALSMWFEQWVQHPGLLASATNPAAFEQTRWFTEVLHRRGLLERGVFAAFDLELHTRSDGDAASALKAVVERYGLRGVRMATMLPYLTWPMQQRNPGGEVSILWAWASAAKTFQNYRLLPFSRIPRAAEPLVQAFDFSAPTPPADAHFAMGFLRR